MRKGQKRSACARVSVALARLPFALVPRATTTRMPRKTASTPIEREPTQDGDAPKVCYLDNFLESARAASSRPPPRPSRAPAQAQPDLPARRPTISQA